MGALLRKNRDHARKLSDEYVRYDLAGGKVGGHPEDLAAKPGLLIVVDEKGAELARVSWADLHGDAGLSAEKLMTFLAKNAVPHPDAEEHYAAALARAKAEDKRLLVHLGAPW